MIQFFRRFFQSKVGIGVTLAFLGLIAVAFASADVSSFGSVGQVSSGDQVAVVGDERVPASELSQAATNTVNNLRRQNPTLSMAVFLEQDGLSQVLDQLLERTAIGEFAQKYGLRAGSNLVNSEILSIAAFKGADGNFSQDSYEQALRQGGLTDAMLRSDLGDGLLARQVLVPAAFGAKMPDAFAERYASLLKESRQGSIAIIPSAAYLPENDPTNEQLSTYYNENRGDYIRPERRIIRYITFGEDAVGDIANPTDREIAARYEEDRETYAPSEKRSITQFIVPTQQAANSIRTRVQAGTSLEAAAREAGLQTATIEDVSRSELASQTSPAVAQAIFATDRGAIAAPARSGLGFHVARVDAVSREAGRNLEQARSEIATALREEKRREAMADLAAEIEERIDDGAALTEVASDLDLEIQTTKPLVGNGMVYESPQERAPEVLAPALQTAFQMDESEPQLAEIERGTTFLVFEVSDITESAAAPLSEIRDGVVAQWKIAQGSKEARKVADRILAKVDDGTSTNAAIAAEKTRLPRADAVRMTREQLAQTGQQVPPPLALMFSMAEGTTKKLQAPNNAGWFVVRLDDIEPGTISKDDPLFQQTKRELAQAVGREYSDQLRKAILAEIGVEKNEDAIEALRRQLSGEN